MTGRVVSIGEALVDMIEVDSDRGHTYLAAWGGSPFNVAVGAARLGSDVEFAGSFASDALGDKMIAFLAEEAVGTDLCPRIDAVYTTIAMTTFVNAEPQYAFYANPASYGFLPPSTANRAQIANADVVHSGSLVVIEDTSYEAITECFAASRGIITFDPNVRPRMVSDWEEYRRRLGYLINQAHFVKFSIEDIEAAYPGQSAESIAMATLDGPTQAVLVTRGGDPVSLYSHDTQTDLPLAGLFPVNDTTGGGDATMAGMVHQLARTGTPDSHEGWVEFVRNALVVASIVSSRRGGAIAMPTAQEVRETGAWTA